MKSVSEWVNGGAHTMAWGERRGSLVLGKHKTKKCLSVTRPSPLQLLARKKELSCSLFAFSHRRLLTDLSLNAKCMNVRSCIIHSFVSRTFSYEYLPIGSA
jgi:hypothetical protein